MFDALLFVKKMSKDLTRSLKQFILLYFVQKDSIYSFSFSFFFFFCNPQYYM